MNQSIGMIDIMLPWKKIYKTQSSLPEKCHSIPLQESVGPPQLSADSIAPDLPVWSAKSRDTVHQNMLKTLLCLAATLHIRFSVVTLLIIDPHGLSSNHW